MRARPSWRRPTRLAGATTAPSPCATTLACRPPSSPGQHLSSFTRIISPTHNTARRLKLYSCIQNFLIQFPALHAQMPACQDSSNYSSSKSHAGRRQDANIVPISCPCIVVVARCSVVTSVSPTGAHTPQDCNTLGHGPEKCRLPRRFDLLHVMIDEPDDILDYRVASHIVAVHQRQDQAFDVPYSMAQVQRYLKYARAHKPELTPSVRGSTPRPWIPQIVQLIQYVVCALVVSQNGLAIAPTILSQLESQY